MNYEWTKWMDVPMRVPCPVQVGEIVETKWETTRMKNHWVTTLTSKLQLEWSAVSVTGPHPGIKMWKYRVKKPNTKAWLQTLETAPVLEDV